MNYYVISKGNSPIAVVFHDYMSSRFIVKSKSEAFRKSFEASSLTNSLYSFNREGSVLKFNRFGSNFISWVDRVLSKFCDDLWSISSKGSVIGESMIDSISNQFLSI